MLFAFVFRSCSPFASCTGGCLSLFIISAVATIQMGGEDVEMHTCTLAHMRAARKQTNSIFFFFLEVSLLFWGKTVMETQ